MNKASRLIKRYIALLLVLLFSIESFAAVVGDNDGAAFITKAEFDSLKNDFQSQLDRYNSSIDNKIDGAIASYLAGVAIAQTQKVQNLYDLLGGQNIKFGFPSIDPTVDELVGWATYWENGDKYGVSTVRMGAQHNGIKNPAEWSWTNVSYGGGQNGKFLIYKEYGGNKFLDKYFYGMLQAVFAGGWWTGANTVRKCMINGPWGASAADVNVPLTPTSSLYADFFTSFYRVYDKEPRVDLSYWTSAYGVDMTVNKIFISETNFGKANARMINKGSGLNADTESTALYNYYNGMATTDGTEHDADDIVYNNVVFYDWDTETSKSYTELYPGFYNGKTYTNKLYAGVHLFESEKQGTVKIEGLKFTKSAGGYVWFAISSAPFSNSDTLSGDVKFTKVTNATIDGADLNRYYASPGAEVTLEFEIKKGLYYIKCQPTKTKSASNTLYCGIEDGATITVTYD
ncbi:MAG: hypothetical protein IJ593_07035 [Lachnospiraceae bacterium]|nr:hypothetical protein [Lachnospiraceae bacterium]